LLSVSTRTQIQSKALPEIFVHVHENHAEKHCKPLTPSEISSKGQQGLVDLSKELSWSKTELTIFNTTLQKDMSEGEDDPVVKSLL